MRQNFFKLFFLLLIGNSILYGKSCQLSSELSFVGFKATSKMFFVASNVVEGENHALSGEIDCQKELVSGVIKIRANSFDSGNTKRDRHLDEILNSDESPFITFTFQGVKLTKDLKEFPGVLKVNNKEEAVVANVKIRETNSQIFIDSNFDVKYESFGIEPPVLGGIIKRAKDEISLNGFIVIEKEKL